MTDHADLIARLRAAIVTASNDARNWMGMARRDRHVARLKAMEEAADALSCPVTVTEEMVERGERAIRLYVASIETRGGETPDPMVDSPEIARAVLTAALGTPAAGPETYPGYDPAAGLPQPSTEKGGDANSDGSLDHGPDNAQPRSPETDGADPGDFVDHAFGPYIRSSETSGEVPTLTETLYRDIFAEITAKATPLEFSATDPDHITAYRVPVGPIHRAAGKLGFQMFDGERYLAEARKALADCNAHEGAIRAEATAKERKRCERIAERRAERFEPKASKQSVGRFALTPLAPDIRSEFRALIAAIRGGGE